jgi:hypothetical protein
VRDLPLLKTPEGTILVSQRSGIRGMSVEPYGSLATGLATAILLCFRIRSMFFEIGNEFSANNISIRSGVNLRDIAKRLLLELNRLSGDAIEAKLDNPANWAQLIGWDLVKDTMEQYSFHDWRIREAASSIVKEKNETVASAKEQFIEEITRFETAFRESNARVLKALVTNMSEAIVS